MRFGVIVADPPWKFDDSYGKRGADKRYKVLPTKKIRNLRVIKLAAKNSVLGLWVPSSMLRDGFRVLRKWGFTLKTVWVWVKQTKKGKLHFGTGYTFRAAVEIALIGTRGKPKCLLRNRRNVFIGPALKHSAKPEAFQDDLERMFSGPCLELFARRRRSGWHCVGLELGEEVRDSIRRLERVAD